MATTPAERAAARPPHRDTVAALALAEARILWRHRTPLVFVFAVPVVLSLILGPAVSGLKGQAAGGRAALGFAVLFSYMTVNYAGHAFYREHWYRTWARHAALKPHRIVYAVGKVTPITVAGFVQLVVLSAYAVGVLHLPLHGSYLQLLPLFLALSASGSALGILLFAVTKTSSAFSSLTYLVLLAFGALGGAIVAPDQLPEASRLAGTVTPHFWAMRGVDEVTVGGGAWWVVWESTAVILAMTVVLAVVGTRRLNLREAKHGAV